MATKGTTLLRRLGHGALSGGLSAAVVAPAATVPVAPADTATARQTVASTALRDQQWRSRLVAGRQPGHDAAEQAAAPANCNLVFRYDYTHPLPDREVHTRGLSISCSRSVPILQAALGTTLHKQGDDGTWRKIDGDAVTRYGPVLGASFTATPWVCNGRACLETHQFKAVAEWNFNIPANYTPVPGPGTTCSILVPGFGSCAASATYKNAIETIQGGSSQAASGPRELRLQFSLVPTPAT